jgi:alginate O-acetyltransferase complex protein AlgI
MAFTSFEFYLFFLAVLFLRAGLGQGSSLKWTLLVASICFYASWNVPCILLIMFTGVVDYSVGKALAARTDPRSRRRLLVVSLATNLGLLGFFKYTDFVLSNLCVILRVAGVDLHASRYNIVLPPGISFFTFSSMSYIIDLYYERIPACRSLRDYSLYVTFFPKLLSGPIARARDFLPQLDSMKPASRTDFEVGLAVFLIGAVKKLVIADQIGSFIDVAFSAPGEHGALTLWQALIGYGVQLYCDFSGYSDMGIGCARMLGFRLPENFQMPYRALSITEFWRRWHITLSNWFRDYVFLPLELATRGSSRPSLRICTNITFTMILCGLWHGPSWNFVVFGAIHGLALATHKLWTGWRPKQLLAGNVMLQYSWVWFSWVLTMSVVLFGLVFFRAASMGDALLYLKHLFIWSSTPAPVWSWKVLLAVVTVALAHVAIGKDRNIAEELPKRPALIRIAVYASCFTLLATLAAPEAAPFIYVQF